MLSTEEPVGPKNVTMHKAYTNALHAVRSARQAKWRLFGTPETLDKLRAKHDGIIVKLAHLMVQMDEDRERSIWQELYDGCMFMSEYFKERSTR